jgi:DNA-binding NarL/FixJ family response regulator
MHRLLCDEQLARKIMAAQSVLIVENEAIARVGYETIVAESGFEIAGSSGSATEALHAAEAKPPSVAVVDIDPGPSSDSLWLAQNLAERFNTRIVFITPPDAPDLLGAASLIGPSSLLQKPVMPVQVIQAINDAMP